MVFDDGAITCESVADPVWGIQWSQTVGGSTDTQRCPGGITDTKGMSGHMEMRLAETAALRLRALPSWLCSLHELTLKHCLLNYVFVLQYRSGCYGNV